jgi:hypothetical protein
MLDMVRACQSIDFGIQAEVIQLSSFAHLVTIHDYGKPCVYTRYLSLRRRSSTSHQRDSGYQKRSSSDPREHHANKICPKRCLRHSTIEVPDHHGLQHEWQEYLHSYCRASLHHGPDRKLVGADPPLGDNINKLTICAVFQQVLHRFRSCITCSREWVWTTMSRVMCQPLQLKCEKSLSSCATSTDAACMLRLKEFRNF